MAVKCNTFGKCIYFLLQVVMEAVTEVTITARTIILETTAAATVLTGGTSKASSRPPKLLLSLLIFYKQIELYLRKTQNSAHNGTHYERTTRDSAGGMSSDSKKLLVYRLYAFKIIFWQMSKLETHLKPIPQRPFCSFYFENVVETWKMLCVGSKVLGYDSATCAAGEENT